MERRKTIQHELVLNAVRAMKSHVSADEVYAFIHKEHPSIGKGTIYRNLSLLAEEGEIRRVEIPGGPDRFDFTLAEHYHVRCVQCNRVFDADMEVIPDMLNRIRDTHGMHFKSYDILFKGVCPECQVKNS